MLFFAVMQDEKLTDLINTIRKHSRLISTGKQFENSGELHNQAYEQLANEFRGILTSHVNNMISKYSWKGLTRDDFSSLYNDAQLYLYETANLPAVFQIPEHNVYGSFVAKLNQMLSKRLIGDAFEMARDTAQPKISGPTLAKVRAVAKFISDYQTQHKTNPSTEIVARELNMNPKTVQSYIDSNHLLNVRHTEDLVGGKSDNVALEHFLVSNDPMPDERYLAKEEQEIIEKAKQRAITQMHSEVGRLTGEDAPTIQKNFPAIIEALYKEQGKNVQSLATYYGVSKVGGVKMLSRLWQKFIYLMKHDQELKRYVNATKSFRNLMMKISSTVFERQLAFETNLIMKIANL